MSEPTVQEQAPASRPPRRWLRRAILGAIILVAVVVGGGLYVNSVWERELRDAIAEAERSDPGWRLVDLENKRPVIPDAENSSVQMARVKQAQPAKWFIWYYPPNAPAPGTDLTLDDPERFSTSLEEIQPPVRLDAEQERVLRSEMMRGAAPVAEARKLIDYPRGRHPITWRKDVISSLLPASQDSRNDVSILRYDVMLLCQDGDLDGAIRSARASYNASLAVRDEPFAVSQLIHIACRRISLTDLERILAQGEPSPDALADFQRLLEEDDRDNPFLVAMRGERGMLDGFLEVIQHGRLSQAELRQALDGLSGNSAGAGLIESNLELLTLRGTVRRDRADVLRRMNRLVDIARLPPEEQREQIVAWQASVKQEGSPLARKLLSAVEKLSQACRRSHADVRCMIVALALERFRRANGRWPGRLDELTPAYLDRISLDPFDGKPLKYARRDDGVTVYSVGPDGQDNGGNVTGRWLEEGTDWGYRLWDADRRHQPPKK
jgi:hypothetical protein